MRHASDVERMVYCDVVIPRTKLGELTYSFEPEQLGELAPGDCVRVTLRGRKKKGIVTGVLSRSPVRHPLPVLEVIERGLVGAELLSLMKWVGRYYWATMGEVLNLAVPQGMCGYRPRARKEVDVSQLVACESAAIDRASCREFTRDRFGVYCSTRTSGRFDLVASFVRCRKERGGVVVLLPNEKLVEWLPRFVSEFGDDLHEYHSSMSLSRRRQAWRSIRSAEHPVVVGVRSAVFAPVTSLAGMVVVDEHSPTLKEERRPRFHARDITITRAKAAGCPVLLCDRTPSAETWFNLEAGAYSRLDSPVVPGPRSADFVVDMHRHRDETFSPRLVRELTRAVQTGVVILYVNRRGLSRHVVCRDCGTVLQCERCAVPLVLGADRSLTCGLCGQMTAAPETCPGCHGTRFLLRSPGIDMVAREAGQLLRGVRPVLVDSDKPGSLPEDKGTLIVGTRALLSRQWPAATRLVAAVRFDYDLVIPDFRTRERAFQALYEMERRARLLGSRFVVQTWRPDDPAVRYAIEQDPAGFLGQEIEQRRQLGFPPARRMALIEFFGRNKRQVSGYAQRIARFVNRLPAAEALGPVPVSRKGKGPGWRLLVRFDRTRSLDRLLPRSKLEAAGVEVRVDPDPQEMC